MPSPRSPKPAPQLAFGYPRKGLSGEFNTFRLGTTWATKCPPGSTVELVCARSKKLLGTATVRFIVVGKLDEMAPRFADLAHNWKGHPVPSERPALLVASMKKRYPPNRVRDDSLVSVIFLTEKNS